MLKDNIKNLREKLSISQRELGRMINMSGQMISKIERGNSNPSIETLEKISKALDVPLNELMDDTGLDRANELTDIYLKGVLSWSEDKRFNTLETTVIREHLSELLQYYKLTIESLANANHNWKYSQENYFTTYRSKGMNDEEIQELFLKQELENQLSELSNSANNLPGYFIYNQRNRE